MKSVPIASMLWENVLFAHWKVKCENLKKCLPTGVELDTYNGEAYLGIVPFFMKEMELTFLPFLSRLSFSQINIRTYVKVANQKGVYFFNLDTNHLLAMLGGKIAFKSPYAYAKITIEKRDNEIFFEHSRPKTDLCFKGIYKPISNTFYAQNGSLEHWLTERYRFYIICKGKVYFGDISHKKWPLHKATLNIEENTLFQNHRLPNPPDKPHLLFSPSLSVKAYPIKLFTL